jgi:putative salt-induced outer membrane protein YdiY
MSALAISIPLLLEVLAAASADASHQEAAPAAEEAPPEYPEWTGAFTLGALWTDGNTITESIATSLNLQRRDEKDRWTLGLYGNYGKTEDSVTGEEDVTTNNSGGDLKYDYFATEKLYFFANTGAKVDHEADLDLRWLAGAGAGYQWVENDKVKWGTELGLAHIDEDFEDDTADEEFLAARVASNLAYAISKNSSFEQVAEVYPSLEDSEDLLAKVDNRLKMNISGNWIGQIQYVFEFDDSTPPDVKEADHRVLASIGWSLGS